MTFTPSPCSAVPMAGRTLPAINLTDWTTAAPAITPTRSPSTLQQTNRWSVFPDLLAAPANRLTSRRSPPPTRPHWACRFRSSTPQTSSRSISIWCTTPRCCRSPDHQGRRPPQRLGPDREPGLPQPVQLHHFRHHADLRQHAQSDYPDRQSSQYGAVRCSRRSAIDQPCRLAAVRRHHSVTGGFDHAESRLPR